MLSYPAPVLPPFGSGPAASISNSVGPVLLAFVYKNTLDDTSTTSDPISDTTVPGLSVTFVLSVITTVKIGAAVCFAKSGGASRFRVYDGSTQLTNAATWPSNGQDAWYSWSGNNNEANNQQVNFMEFRSLAAGSHTINIREQAAANTNAIKWGERCLFVEAMS